MIQGTSRRVIWEPVWADLRHARRRSAVPSDLPPGVSPVPWELSVPADAEPTARRILVLQWGRLEVLEEISRVVVDCGSASEVAVGPAAAGAEGDRADAGARG